MPISELSAVERIARVLVAERLSANAEGYEASVGDDVNAEWQRYVGQAIAVLKTLREPDMSWLMQAIQSYGAPWWRRRLPIAGEPRPRVEAVILPCPNPTL